MSREHYAWGSFRRTGRQLGFLTVVLGVGFVIVAFLIWAVGQLWTIHSRKGQEAEWQVEGGAGSLLSDEDRPDEDALIAPRRI